MTRIGQCPSCRSIYELEDDAIGQVFECECNTVLFAADFVGFSEIPVACSQCDGQYVVDRDGAGEEVECECGATLIVPNVVLRQPVNSRDGDVRAVAEHSEGVTKEETGFDESVPSVSCPQCDARFVVSESDVGVAAQCDCGHVFVTQGDEDGEFVAVEYVPEPEPDDDGAEADEEPQPGSASQATQGTRKQSPRKKAFHDGDCRSRRGRFAAAVFSDTIYVTSSRHARSVPARFQATASQGDADPIGTIRPTVF